MCISWSLSRVLGFIIHVIFHGYAIACGECAVMLTLTKLAGTTARASGASSHTWTVSKTSTPEVSLKISTRPKLCVEVTHHVSPWYISISCISVECRAHFFIHTSLSRDAPISFEGVSFKMERRLGNCWSRVRPEIGRGGKCYQGWLLGTSPNST